MLLKTLIKYNGLIPSYISGARFEEIIVIFKCINEDFRKTNLELFLKSKNYNIDFNINARNIIEYNTKLSLTKETTVSIDNNFLFQDKEIKYVMLSFFNTEDDFLLEIYVGEQIANALDYYKQDGRTKDWLKKVYSIDMYNLLSFDLNINNAEIVTKLIPFRESVIDEEANFELKEIKEFSVSDSISNASNLSEEVNRIFSTYKLNYIIRS